MIDRDRLQRLVQYTADLANVVEVQQLHMAVLMNLPAIAHGRRGFWSATVQGDIEKGATVYRAIRELAGELSEMQAYVDSQGGDVDAIRRAMECD